MNYFLQVKDLYSVSVQMTKAPGMWLVRGLISFNLAMLLSYVIRKLESEYECYKDRPQMLL